MIESLIAVGLLLVLISLTYAVGALCLRRFTDWTGALEKAVFAIPIGMGVVSYLMLALGLLRLFRPPIFYGIFGVGVLAAPYTIRDLIRARKPDATGKRSRLGLIVGIVLALLGVCVLIAALAPPTEWDALSYHLAGPKTYLRNGRIFYIPYDHHTNFPFLLQMLYTLMLGVGSIGGAKLSHTLCGAVLIASVYTFATRHLPGPRGKRVGALAVLILASTPMVIWEMTVAYSDLATALYTWLAVYAALNSLTPDSLSFACERGGPPNAGTSPGVSDPRIERRTSAAYLALSAALIGGALATKFTVLAYWLLLLFGIVAAIYLRHRRLSLPDIRLIGTWKVVSLLVAAPWYIKTYLYTGNPTYPFLYGLFGGRYWSAENAAKYAASQAQLGGDKSAIGLLTVPWESTMLPDALLKHFTEYFTFNLSPVFLGLLIALPLLGRRLSRPIAIAGWFGLGVTAFWFFSVQQTRYLLPALPCFALVCAEAVVILWELRGRFERWAAAGLMALAGVWGLYLAGGMAFWGVTDFYGNAAASAARPVVTGQVSREEYVERHTPGGVGWVEFWINKNTPKDAKVALFEMERGFYLDRDYIWAQPDHAAGLIPWDSYRDTDDWLADFKRRGYTVLLVGARDPAGPPQEERWRTLLDDAIRGDKVTQIYAGPGMRSKDGLPIPVYVYEIP